jgi:diguanylate cyclase (GGDEF)-like protein/PAS domain S-box-containing protein
MQTGLRLIEEMRPFPVDAPGTAGAAGRQMVDALPMAVYACDAFGLIVHHNEAAAALWGRRPEIGKEFWCGSWKMFHSDGRAMAHESSPMTQALLTGRAVDESNILMERPDGTRVQVSSHVRPLRDASGMLTGAINTLIDTTASKQALQRMWESDLTWRLMFDCSPVAQLLLKPDWAISSVNQRFVLLSGYAREELVGASPNALRLYVEDELGKRLLAALSADSSVEGLEFHLRRKDGKVRLILISSCPVSVDGASQRLHSLVDITELKAQQSQLKLAAQVFAQGREGLLVTDAHRNIILVNQAFTSILGYEAADVVGKNPRIFASGRQDRKFYQSVWQAVNRDGEWQGEVRNRHKNGKIFPEHLRITVVRDADGAVSNYVGTFSDMSQEKAAHERINWLSHFDALTGLPNRATLAERCNHEVLSPDRASRPMAMVMLGIDRFMGVNDTLGHATGDELLKQFSRRVRDALKTRDVLARSGGDEFALVLPDQSAQDAQNLAAQLLQRVSRPYCIEGNEVNITASIGIAQYPGDGLDSHALFKSAEVAMHQAKDLGRGRSCVFNARMLESAIAHAALVSHLRGAVAQDQLQLHYQPFVDLQTGMVSGMEALLRWHHPELGGVSPARFIPAAEKSGLIGEIGSWVLRRACRDMRSWLDRGIPVPPVSINISPIQFRNHRLLQEIEGSLREFSLDPGRLCVEVTEGALMEDAQHSETVLRSLRELGVRLSLDDFGTGYSSLSYLKLFPFDKVKIDQSFVRGLTTNPQDAVIARVVISMAHGLGLHVIAEGVETEAQAEFMRANRCDEIQGYFFSRPIPREELEVLIESGRRLPSNLIRVDT